MMNATRLAYADFDKTRQTVADMLGHIAECFSKLEATKRADILLLTQKSLRDDAFRLLVLGEFSRGKSTLINAILGEKVLPMKIAPCTAVITKVCYGETKKAIFQYRDGHRETVDLVAIPDALKNHIVIKENEPNPVEYCEIQYPLPILRNGVEIVDSPGLNESEIRSEITCGFFAQSDAMIFVLNCEHAMAASERSFIDNELKDRDLRDVFFLWNRYDAIRDSPEDIADIQKISKDKLESKLNVPMRIFYISARDALKGRLQADMNALEVSNIQPFESALEEFLTTERGRAKLRGPLKIGSQAIQQGLTEVLPQREQLAKTPLQALKKLYAEQLPKLEAAERIQAKIVRIIDRQGEAIKRQSRSMIHLIHLEMESGLIRICQESDVNFTDAAFQQEATKNRIIQQYSNWATPKLDAWKKHEYDPLISDSFMDLENELTDEVHELLEALSGLQSMFNERTDLVVASNGGQLVQSGNSLSQLFDLATDDRVDGMAVSGVALAAGIGIAIFHLPVIIIGSTLLALGAGNAFFSARRRAQEIRNDVIATVSDALQNSSAQMAKATDEMIESRLNLIRSRVVDRLGVQVNDARSQVEAAIRKKEQAESESEVELQRLAVIRNKLTELQADLQGIATAYTID